MSVTKKPTPLNDLIDQYFELERDIKKKLGWVDDWKILPLDDVRDNYWMLVGGNADTGDESIVVISIPHGDSDVHEPFTLDAVRDGHACSGSDVYTQRGHERWVYREGGIVLIPVNTHTDGNVFLYLLDAAKEEHDEKIKACYLKHWGHV